MQLVTMYLNFGPTAKGLATEEQVNQWVTFLVEPDYDIGTIAVLGYEKPESAILSVKPSDRVVHYIDLERVAIIKCENVPDHLVGYVPVTV